MKVLIPVLDKNGEQSRISPHFGRAPYLALVDIDESGKILGISFTEGEGPHEERGESEHASAIRKGIHERIIGLRPDAIMVMRIGPRALYDFITHGIRIMRIPEAAVTIIDAINSLRMGTTEEYVLEDES